MSAIRIRREIPPNRDHPRDRSLNLASRNQVIQPTAPTREHEHENDEEHD
jgi:hypothetical protein